MPLYLDMVSILLCRDFHSITVESYLQAIEIKFLKCGLHADCG